MSKSTRCRCASARRSRIPAGFVCLTCWQKASALFSDLQGELGITTANVSQHLAILKAAGVVTTRRDGKQIYCSLTIPEVKQACQLIRNVLRAQVRNERKLEI